MYKIVGKLKKEAKTMAYRGFYFAKYLTIKLLGKSIIFDNNHFYIEGANESLEENHTNKDSIHRELFRHEMYIINILDIPIKYSSNAK